MSVIGRKYRVGLSRLRWYWRRCAMRQRTLPRFGGEANQITLSGGAGRGRAQSVPGSSWSSRDELGERKLA